MSKLAEFLKGDARRVHAESERRKAEKLDWQQAVIELNKQLLAWRAEADPEGVLQYRRTPHTFQDYDVGDYTLEGLSFILGNSTVRVVPGNWAVFGVLQLPGEDHPRKIFGRVDFDNGIDRVPLYRVKIGDQDEWFWWAHGGIGKPFDRESFEATLVSLFR